MLFIETNNRLLTQRMMLQILRLKSTILLQSQCKCACVSLLLNGCLWIQSNLYKHMHHRRVGRFDYFRTVICQIKWIRKPCFEVHDLLSNWISWFHWVYRLKSLEITLMSMILRSYYDIWMFHIDLLLKFPIDWSHRLKKISNFNTVSE